MPIIGASEGERMHREKLIQDRNIAILRAAVEIHYQRKREGPNSVLDSVAMASAFMIEVEKMQQYREKNPPIRREVSNDEKEERRGKRA